MQISIEHSSGAVYRVVVTHGRGTTTHEVTVTAEDVARYAPGSTPERLLEASFEFLLEREVRVQHFEVLASTAP